MSSESREGFSEHRREPQARSHRADGEPRRRRRDDDEYRPPRPLPADSSNPMKIILIVLGIVVLIALLCGGSIFALTFWSVGKVRTAAGRMQTANNVKQIGLGLHNHHDFQHHMAPSLLTKDGKPGLSWRVAILPYIEQVSLYKQFKIDEPWDSPNNIRLLDQMPLVYVNARMPHPSNETCYRVFVGGGAMFDHGHKTMFGGSGKKALKDIVVNDGLTNTIMVVESATTVPWTKPDELVFDPNGPLPPLGASDDDNFVALMADGSVRFVPKNTLAATLRAAITANGGEIVTLP